MRTGPLHNGLKLYEMNSGASEWACVKTKLSELCRSSVERMNKRLFLNHSIHCASMKSLESHVFQSRYNLEINRFQTRDVDQQFLSVFDSWSRNTVTRSEAGRYWEEGGWLLRKKRSTWRFLSTMVQKSVILRDLITHFPMNLEMREWARERMNACNGALK